MNESQLQKEVITLKYIDYQGIIYVKRKNGITEMNKQQDTIKKYQEELKSRT